MMLVQCIFIDRLCHTRELAIVEMEEPELRKLMPEIYYSISSISKVSSFVVFLSLLTSCFYAGYVCVCDGVSP